MALWITLGVIAVIILWAVRVFNGLVGKRNRYKNGYAQIDVQLKRRYDLIPNMVATAKGYMAHEKDTLIGVTEARNKALAAAKAASANPGDPGLMKALGGAEGVLKNAMMNLEVVMERYPELKANESIAEVMEELRSTENRISFARQAFNDQVTDFNTAREKFPASVVANIGRFTLASLLEIEFAEGGRDAPKVDF
jgi:LemA protein